MKNLRQLCMAGALSCALALPAFAGTIHTMVTAPPPVPSASTTGGTIQTGEATAGGSVAEIVLNLLQSMFSLL